jgi:hypothetical protein
MVQTNKERMKKGVMMGLLVEADALAIILNDKEFKSLFLKISKTAEAVIACRVSPS